MACSARDGRVTVMLLLTIIAALLALAQRTVWAPLPHSIDDFLGGLAVGLAVSTLIARSMARA
jgi:hypothetical protein